METTLATQLKVNYLESFLYFLIQRILRIGYTRNPYYLIIYFLIFLKLINETLYVMIHA